MSARSARARTSARAPAIWMPWPARMMGRLAWRISSRARARASGSRGGGRWRRCRLGSTASQSSSARPCWASLVMSTSTGPGRPLFATAKASRSTGTMSAARVTR